MAGKKKQTKASIYVWILRALSLTGIVIMIYLARLHFTEDVSTGAICELGEGLSCEAVNTSKYSEVLGIPVSFLGVGYFGLLLLVSFTKLSKDMWKNIFLLTLFVLVPSLYLSSLELFVINSICIFCEISKLLMLAVLITAGKFLMDKKSMPKGNLIVGVLVVGLVSAGVMWFLQTRDTSEKDYTALAQCLTENGVIMYGSITCTVCAREREVFGDAFAYMTEIECNPRGEHAQTELCLEKEIAHTPTFTREVNGEELERKDGFQSPEDLAKFGDCEGSLPLE